jgi:hypothetical protein
LNNGKWRPGEEVRDCWYCPYNRVGKGTPKLECFEDDPDYTCCNTYRQWGLNLLLDEAGIIGIPSIIEAGSSIFKKEYTSLQPFVANGVTFGPFDFFTFQLRLVNLITPLTVVANIRTKMIKFDTGAAYCPVFGIERILSKEEFVRSKALSGEIKQQLALTGASSLDNMAEDFDEGTGEHAMSEYAPEFSGPPEEVF